VPLPVVVPAFPAPEDLEVLREIADELGPWLQGPFPLAGALAVDGAWRCDARWGVLAPLVGELHGERVLDVGSNAGYDAFMLRTLGAGHVLGVEPYGFHDQAVFLERLYATGVEFRRMGWQGLDPEVHGRFDLVHCGSLLLREPHVVRLLLRLREMTADGGRLLLGTVVEDGAADGRVRFTPGSVAGDPTWWWVPDARALHELLGAVGFDVLADVRAGEDPVAPFPCSARYVLARAARPPSEELLAAELPAAVGSLA
jgi:tRNA (mo5U34)-methyltransferase